MGVPVSLVCEDDVHLAILEKILRPYDIEVESVYDRRGKYYVRDNINFYNAAAMNYHLILVDLDIDEYPCAPALLSEYLPAEVNPKLILRVAIEEAEAWLIADHVNFSRYFSIPNRRIRRDAEQIYHPKEYLLSLIERYSTDTTLSSIVPENGIFARVGRRYNRIMTDFTLNHWNPDNARRNSPSLHRALLKINSIFHN